MGEELPHCLVLNVCVFYCSKIRRNSAIFNPVVKGRKKGYKRGIQGKKILTTHLITESESQKTKALISGSDWSGQGPASACCVHHCCLITVFDPIFFVSHFLSGTTLEKTVPLIIST